MNRGAVVSSSFKKLALCTHILYLHVLYMYMYVAYLLCRMYVLINKV